MTLPMRYIPQWVDDEKWVPFISDDGGILAFPTEAEAREHLRQFPIFNTRLVIEMEQTCQQK